jgi:hypothetical protein
LSSKRSSEAVIEMGTVIPPRRETFCRAYTANQRRVGGRLPVD